MIEITLGFPPSVNAYKKIGKIVKTKTGKLYQQRVNTNETKIFYFEAYIKAKALKRPEGCLFCFREDARLEVHIDFYPPSLTYKWDLDNRLKVLCDSLMHARIIKDDSQIYCLVVQKKAMIAQGRTIVRIKEYVP